MPFERSYNEEPPEPENFWGVPSQTMFPLTEAQKRDVATSMQPSDEEREKIEDYGDIDLDDFGRTMYDGPLFDKSGRILLSDEMSKQMFDILHRRKTLPRDNAPKDAIDVMVEAFRLSMESIYPPATTRVKPLTKEDGDALKKIADDLRVIAYSVGQDGQTAEFPRMDRPADPTALASTAFDEMQAQIVREMQEG